MLKRDGTNVTVGSNCYPTSGSWRSPYDGATWTSWKRPLSSYYCTYSKMWIASK